MCAAAPHIVVDIVAAPDTSMLHDLLDAFTSNAA
jgi:hypothetical protein